MSHDLEVYLDMRRELHEYTFDLADDFIHQLPNLDRDDIHRLHSINEAAIYDKCQDCSISYEYYWGTYLRHVENG